MGKQIEEQQADNDSGVKNPKAVIKSKALACNQRGRQANVPKLFLNYLLKREHPEYQCELWKKWRDKLLERYKRNENWGRRTQLVEMFGPGEGITRIINARSRRWMQRLLGTQKGRMVLRNRNIVTHQHTNYLYFLKIYEWRLNSPELVDRLG